MLEGLVAWVLNNYLGKYVENLNTDQLSIALLQGAVELENLPLRKDALRNFGLPVEIRAGFIGKIKLKVPVSQIRSAPWEIIIERLYLVAGPIRLADWDDEAEEHAAHEYKLSLLDAIEAGWRAEADTAQEYSYYASSYSSWLSYGTSLVTNIVENLQLKIEDVHFRYEDDVTVPGISVALGVRIDSLTAQSCDELWIPKFLTSDSTGFSYKLLQLSNLAVYWDVITKEQMFGDLNITELAAAMSPTSANKNLYILAPVSAQAHVKRNKSEVPIRSRTHPRIVCNLQFEEVCLTLTDEQYGQMVKCFKDLGNIQLSQRFRKNRPTCSVHEDPKAWWKHAISSVQIPRHTWTTMHQRAKENIEYVEIYTRLLSNHTALSPLPPEKKEIKEKIEWERSFEDLKSLREVAMCRVRPPPAVKPTDSHIQGRSVLVSWFPQWWGWYTSPAQEQEQLQDTKSTSAALEDEILDALADTMENNTLLKRDTVFGQFNFTLKQGTFNLCQQKPNKQTVMELQFENVQLGVESRPRTGSHCFNMALGAVSLRDHLTQNSAFPVLVSPQSSESAPSGRPSRNLPPGLQRLLHQNSSGAKEEPLFQLHYEYKPFSCSADYKLEIHLESLDVVYNPGAVKWLVDFFTKPHQFADPGFKSAARQGYNAMKQRTKQELLRNWENILKGHLNSRKTWDIDLAISAPQIFLVENFSDKNAILCVVDFGKLHFTNRELKDQQEIAEKKKEGGGEEDDEEEEFQTPCSTPPGSEASDPEEIMELPSVLDQPLDPTSSFSELALHFKLYDRYTVELNDLQILVGRVKDNWKFAHLKGTSTLHVLDRFNISLQVERRIVYTIDPQFPSLTLSGNLPKLVVHINEQKIQALRTLFCVISGTGLPSPFRPHENTPVEDPMENSVIDEHLSIVEGDEKSDNASARLLMLQFGVDQLALEVQSRGRSVAELQVSGVVLSFTKRPYDTSLMLSVHGLLLVDALQTFGPDFELLVASHKHVGMDSVSGSLRDSEPTSPTSPGSPDPLYNRTLRTSTTLRSEIVNALSSLSLEQQNRAKSPTFFYPSSPPSMSTTITSPRPPMHPVALELPSIEALITVELVFVSADCPTNTDKNEHLQIANIQFNNLDIIANQETIVELIGFVRRVFPQQKSIPRAAPSPPPTISVEDETDGDISINSSRRESSALPPSTRTKLTFDFHRLNILLLRAVLKDNVLVGRKIATATMSQAKIFTDVGSELVMQGSLGGLQILDLTPEGQTHQRILSLGQDPLTDDSKNKLDLMACLSADLYNMSGCSNRRRSEPEQEKEAFSFCLKRSLDVESDTADISVRFASVWYTHSPRLLSELQSCATEFKKYLANLARSIGTAATEMAIGLVHARVESLAQSLSMSSRLYGSSSDIASTPRKRRRSLSQSMEHLDSGATTARGSITPFSPAEIPESRTRIHWDVILDTPVVVVPRSANSNQVLVAHLGRMSLTNTLNKQSPQQWADDIDLTELFDIEIRDMNVYTLDTKKTSSTAQTGTDCPLLRVDKLYNCAEEGKTVLHDTVIQFRVEREVGQFRMRQTEDILLEEGPDFTQAEKKDNVQIVGKVVTPLKVSLSRQQYEQVLETISSVLSSEKHCQEDVSSTKAQEQKERVLVDIEEETELHTGVSTLNLDPKLRARLMLQAPVQVSSDQCSMILKVSFDLPELTVELKADFGSGEQGLVDLSFRDLKVQYDKSHHLETNIQMSLRSLIMEDLLQPPDSKHRSIMTSSFPQEALAMPWSGFVSKSCPNLAAMHTHGRLSMHSSLPDHLEAENVFGGIAKKPRHLTVDSRTTKHNKKSPEQLYPCTPPPSPRGTASPNVFREDNLVHINVILRAPRHQGLNMSRHVTIDFNSLDIVVNFESWVVVLDFFGISNNDPNEEHSKEKSNVNEKVDTSLANEQSAMNSEFEVYVRSLTVILNRSDYEVARANMSHLSARVNTLGGSGITDTEASVGSLSLLDLTPVHGSMYREKFITNGLNMIVKKYNIPDLTLSRESDMYLKLDMTSVLYVHTQRFVAELQAFFRHFSKLQRRLGSIRSSRKATEFEGPSTRLKLQLLAASPIIILPVSSRSSEVLIANFGKLMSNNTFCTSGAEGTISKVNDTSKKVVLDVIEIQLFDMDLLTGTRCKESQPGCINLGSYSIEIQGCSLLREKCHMQLHVERNLMAHIANSVPDMSVKGTLSTLAATIDVEQYKLIHGLLNFNIGENLDNLQPPNAAESNKRKPKVVPKQEAPRLCTSLDLELLDVSVCIKPTPYLTLACINFIRSHLSVESYSDSTQDIDLVSQEILITDTRFSNDPANKRANVFTNILQPIVMTSGDGVQVQVHHRRLADLSTFTILLNNLRLMAILDWWEALRDFIVIHPDNPLPEKQETLHQEWQIPFELKLNITDSEVVFVEDTSQWDTNAVIIKNTTVLTYRPLMTEKPVSCNLNHCEMFSCVLGMESETALSIIDPVTVNMEIVNRHTELKDFKLLKVQMLNLSLRLSYHDVRMFSQMLESLPKQTKYGKAIYKRPDENKPANFRNQMRKLSMLGFRLEDCSLALEHCSGHLDDAALWLTQNAVPAHSDQDIIMSESERAFSQVEVLTENLSICIIDDCQDADVPLLELSMSNLKLKHDLVDGEGSLGCKLSSDYYNRILSGWEPFLEPWSCQVQWEHHQNFNGATNRRQLFITSMDTLNLNITSTLVELYSSVKETWTQDYYNPKDSTNNGKAVASPSGYRRRSPFVAFALRNDTGSRMWYTTITASNDCIHNQLGIFETESYYKNRNCNWIPVDPGDTVPFSFEERGKLRHRDTHKFHTHKLGVRVDGWQEIDPVSVDRVGVYFRQASPVDNLLQARVVLEVTLEGSARKLITVRSALQLCNQLPDTIEVKFDNGRIYHERPKYLVVGPGTTLPVPLAYASAKMWVRPMGNSQLPTHYHTFCDRPIPWQEITRPGTVAQVQRWCNSNKGQNYKSEDVGLTVEASNPFGLCDGGKIRFSVVIRRENYPYEGPPPHTYEWMQPAHTITLLSALTIHNLLPYELMYNIRNITKGRIRPGQQVNIHEVSQESAINLTLNLENYPGPGSLTIPSNPTSFTAKLRLLDQPYMYKQRMLYLQAAVTLHPSSGLKVYISAPFWLVNKTGLPIVFRQEGVTAETAGQYEEHEATRMVSPLLFSFTDQDASPTVVARIGNKVHRDGTPQWCHPFTLQPGIKERRLRVILSGNRPELVYMIGIYVRPGKGHYSTTNIVTLSAHYQIHNKSSFKIQLSQLFFASTVSDPGAEATYLQTLPDCSLAFHWPRLDKPLLLCLRLMDVPFCHWSGGFEIDKSDSFHVNIRDPSGQKMYFIRVEIVIQGATNFIVLSNADTMPPPIRIDNFSQVPITFYQDKVHIISTVRAHTSIPYALDEPSKPHRLVIAAPGGVCATYDINKLQTGPDLTYENFIYIAFTGTFKSSGDGEDPLDVTCQQLVLDVPDSSGRVILSRKQFGARSQLWRMTSDGQLQHEGSSPPRASADKILVLDISTPAPQPSQYVTLCLRRPDKRRQSTQTWRLTDEGRLCCVHNNMCVQAKDGFFGLRQRSEAVLGPPQPVCNQLTESGIPLEQAVSRQRLRPGSGFLTVKVLTDGPTRVLQISDINDTRMVAVLEDKDWIHISSNKKSNVLTDDSSIAAPKDSKEFELNVELPCIGISLISRQPPEELLYIKLSSIRLNVLWTREAEMLDACIRDIQVDNQLFEAQCPVLLYVTPMTRTTDPEESARPALQITGERLPHSKNSNAEIFKHLVVRIKNMSLNIEELFLLKLFAFIGCPMQDEQESADESDFETQRILAEATSVHAKRYHFGTLKLIFTKVRLSAVTSSKLSDELATIKRKLNMTLITFEDAAVELKPFEKYHIFENSPLLFSSIVNHYKQELMCQAAIILGSFDFLGNPLGFMNDLSEGMSGLIYEGNVGALVKNVTHGISNSTAKVTGSLSDGLGKVILDDQHEEIRQQIRRSQSGHLVIGFKGLIFGLYGGATSVFTQTYKGAANDGIPGFVSGLGKGIIGTFTKPVLGVLDLASQTASAVRDSSRSSSRQSPSRTRPTRCVSSPSGLLPVYNKIHSQGQEYLYSMNNRKYTELFMAYEGLRSGTEDFRIIISSEKVRVFAYSATSNTCTVVVEALLKNLHSCTSYSSMEGFFYIVLCYNTSSGLKASNTTQVRCDSLNIANLVSQQINHAITMYTERQFTLASTSDNVIED